MPKLIEVALPLEAINEASAREKSIRHGHPNTLHLWWARRPLAACRAVLFTSLVDDPDDPTAPPDFVAACRALPAGANAAANDTPRQRLFDFIERLVRWEATTDEAILAQARQLIRLAMPLDPQTGQRQSPPPLLDPFAGGGSIPLEAQRLGLEAHASDLNPVAVMINKALIEIPPKFAGRPPVNPRDRAAIGGKGGWKGATGLAADVRYYGEWMRQRAWQQIGHLYPKHKGETVIAWLWARTVKCPNPACGAQMPLVRSFDLSTKTGKQVWVEPQVDSQTNQITFEVKQAAKGNGPKGTVDRNGAICLACHTIVPLAHVRVEGQAKRMGAQLMAIVTEGQNGRNYHSPNLEQSQIAATAQPEWKPAGELQGKCRVSVPLYGMNNFADLFTARQLTALTTFSDLVAEARAQIEADAQQANLPNDPAGLREGGTGPRAYAEAVSVYLAFAVDKGANYWSSLCAWHTSRDIIMSTFGRQALPMVWDFTEANPFSNSSGNFDSGVAQAAKSLEASPIDSLPATVFQADAAHNQATKSVVISTDPPYYDNIGYADLSDFFYVWLRYAIREIYPNLFGTMLVPKTPELVATPYRFAGDKKAANQHFETGLMQAFATMRSNIVPEYPLSVYYAFKQQEVALEEGTASTGWETMLSGLIETGFQILGTWPVRTELTSALKATVNALASSIVLVCRPRPANAPSISRREFVNLLRRELPIALANLQSGAIAPVDLAQASIGPGMAVYSRYRHILELDGGRLTVRVALQLINQELDSYLSEQEGEIDGDSRFAVAWFEQFGFNQGAFGEADVLARAKNTSVEGLVQGGLVVATAGKVRLLAASELDPAWDPVADSRPAVWKATHHLIERLNNHGESGAAMLLAKMAPDLAANARHLAYRLYNLCERKKWDGPAGDYNALVISWNASQEQAQSFRHQPKQKRLEL